MIHYRNTVRASGVDARAVKRAAKILLEQVGEKQSTLSISFVDDAQIRILNRLHRGKDKATDVLSFPLAADDQGTTGQTQGVERLLGDVVISVETARRQAADYDATLESEIERLLIHGVLHVMGHDHEVEDERRRMQVEERRLAAAIGLEWPYDE
ncbi:MAG: rRNA maturation RNase YbeY [Vulcanimicrobiaceae bacterium]